MKRLVLVVALAVLSSCGALSGVLPGRLSVGGQSKECKDFVECSERVNLVGSTHNDNEALFGPTGSCWISGDWPSAPAAVREQRADQCTASCKTGNSEFKSNGSAADAGCTL